MRDNIAARVLALTWVVLVFVSFIVLFLRETWPKLASLVTP